MEDAMYSCSRRLAFKGQVFSAPMDWGNLQSQIEAMEREEVHIALPVVGNVLAARVRVQIASGLVDLNKCLREATVRRPVVMQLIRMHRDAGFPEYQKLNMAEVARRCKELADRLEQGLDLVGALLAWYNNCDASQEGWNIAVLRGDLPILLLSAGSCGRTAKPGRRL